MTSTITPQTKNTATLTNQPATPQAVTWNEATDTWNDVQGTWDRPGTVYANATKNTSILGTQKEQGYSQEYNESSLTYNASVFDGKVVYYDSIGLATSYSNITKNTATISNQTKN